MPVETVDVNVSAAEGTLDRAVEVGEGTFAAHAGAGAGVSTLPQFEMLSLRTLGESVAACAPVSQYACLTQNSVRKCKKQDLSLILHPQTVKVESGTCHAFVVILGIVPRFRPFMLRRVIYINRPSSTLLPMILKKDIITPTCNRSNPMRHCESLTNCSPAELIERQNDSSLFHLRESECIWSVH